MKENRYDDEEFFQKYSQMSRSQKGLSGAGEWSTLKKLLPDFAGKRVLDLGCGYGWHCIYAAGAGGRFRDWSRSFRSDAVGGEGKNEVSASTVSAVRHRGHRFFAGKL